MDLYLTLGRFDTIADMLETLDCFEYDFLLEKYRNMTFGPSMVNYQLSQIAWAVVNSVSKNDVKFERFVMGELGNAEATESDNCAVSLITQDYYEYYIAEGFSENQALINANKKAKEYGENLRQKRIEEAMEVEDEQDLSTANKKETEPQDLKDA